VAINNYELTATVTVGAGTPATVVAGGSYGTDTN
jgi:hypothetical protein